MEIKSWEDYFLDLAKTCASRSNWGCAPHHHHRGCQQPSDLF